jgi:hypothetical protein
MNGGNGRRRRRRSAIGGQFSARLIEMIKSPAFRSTSLGARKILDCIEVEHAAHGGNDNGRLPVTYSDIEKYGLERKSIAPAIRELCALGLLEITERGRPSKADWRFPSKFRLTYRWSDDQAPTHEWRRIRDLDHGKRVAAIARAEKDPALVERSKLAAARCMEEKKAKSQGCSTTLAVGEQNGPTEPGGETPPTSQGGNTPLTSTISGAVA